MYTYDSAIIRKPSAARSEVENYKESEVELILKQFLWMKMKLKLWLPVSGPFNGENYEIPHWVF